MLKKVKSIFLALIMLASHMGFAIGTHFCGGQAVEAKLMFGHKHLDCGMADMDKECESKSFGNTYLDKTPCCENEYLSIQLGDELKNGVNKTKINVDFVAAFFVSYIELFSSDQEKLQILTYDPPLVSRDISILYQVFII